MIALTSSYHEQFQGAGYRTYAREHPLHGPEEAAVRAAVKSFLDGKLKPLRARCLVELDLGDDETPMTIVEHKTERVTDKKTGKVHRRHSHERVRLGLKHVRVAKLFVRDREHNTETVDGKPIKPFVAVSFYDGSKVEIPYTPPKGK